MIEPKIVSLYTATCGWHKGRTAVKGKLPTLGVYDAPGQRPALVQAVLHASKASPFWHARTGLIDSDVLCKFTFTRTYHRWNNGGGFSRDTVTNYRLARKAARQHEIEQACRDYLDLARVYLERALDSLAGLKKIHRVPSGLVAKLDTFCGHAERQIEQIRRRILQCEPIAHEEKVFSLFQPHTEWISKGKAGVPVELGVRVCILEDYYGFILHSQVMQNTTDDKVALPMVQAAKAQFPDLHPVSSDKGFHSTGNQQELKGLLDHVVLPKKGKCSKAEQERETAPEFRTARRRHSAVESAINALQVHGLDRCPDHGIEGFERYVALAVLSRNIQQLGAMIRSQERQRLADQQKQAA